MFYKQKRLSLIHITINTSAFFLVIKYFYKMQNKSLKNLVKNQDLLKFLGAKVKSKYRKAIIQIADRNLIKSICEAALNLLKGNIHLTDNQKQKLAKFKNTIRRLASKSNLSDKKKLLFKKEAFWNFWFLL